MLQSPSAQARAITRIHSYALNIPAEITAAGVTRSLDLSAVVCTVETADGHVGHGFTAITEERTVAEAIREVAAPALEGMDPLATEAIWEKLFWLMSPRGQTGYAAHAISAVDTALWDLKGKILGQPVWRLLGGARRDVPVYVTCGFNFLTIDQLVQSAQFWVDAGFKRLKMTVAPEATRRRDVIDVAEMIAEDARRVAAVREAVGPEVQLFIDANCNLDPHSAFKLAQAVAPYRVDFFEEPLLKNDIGWLADLRRRCPVPLAGGQNEGLSYRFRDLLVEKCVDVLQPNVVIGGGFTQAQKIAAMADAFATPIANGGGWPFHNAHLHAGVSNGGLVEYHVPAVNVCEKIFTGLQKPERGRMSLSERPGLGFDLNMEAVEAFAARPSAAGHGKG
ncbi:MAG: mandelate racemase/muconate lactonizing enzyme family protein [Nitratireductor sp.]|uniref:mandelate racemase/muconate lactonizing enzyme family protein n=1 Tax=Nitratireductor sp. TaxID=1872084 RepID=UPI00260B0A53|nr:mandelate racemase/muconate lactonizing enzyme family protein [Nitratireductor sp.]MCV0348620.1 mandelate racemase/muconate lactonizing enzyme family protein [Nitratireductor sp.]